MISEYFPEKTVRRQFKHKKVELVRSLRKRITAAIQRAKTSFYDNKIGSNLKNWLKLILVETHQVFDT